MSQGDAVTIDISARIASIELRRADRRNALSLETCVALSTAIREAREARCAVAILQAERPAFCAGMDLRSIALDDAAQAERFASALSDVYLDILTFPGTFLSVVEGAALGGGVGLAAAADLVYLGPDAVFSLPETRLGIVPALVSVVLRRRLTPAVLARLALSAERVDARKALSLGLADSIETGDVRSRALREARRIAERHSREANAKTKEFLHSLEDDLASQLAAARAIFLETARSPHARRGLQAFREKRETNWCEEES